MAAERIPEPLINRGRWGHVHIVLESGFYYSSVYCTETELAEVDKKMAPKWIVPHTAKTTFKTVEVDRPMVTQQLS